MLRAAQIRRVTTRRPLVIGGRRVRVVAIVLDVPVTDRPAVALFRPRRLVHRPVEVHRLELASTGERDAPGLADVREEQVGHAAVCLAVPVDAVRRPQVHMVAEVEVKVEDVVAGVDHSLLRVEVALDHVQAQKVLAEPGGRN